MTSSTKQKFNLIFITDDPDCAALVSNAGVDRVMVDLEIIGKVERQGHLNTVISRHLPETIKRVRKRLDKEGCGEVLVRVNPLHSKSLYEVDEAIELGAQRLMLPMFHSQEDVQSFIDLVDGRLPVTLLLETYSAYNKLDAILQVKGDYDIHVGLNDLHLDMGLTFMFELLVNGAVDGIAHLCNKAGRTFGIGGVAPLSTIAKLSPRDIISYHKSIGSSGVILSRGWSLYLDHADLFEREVQILRALLDSEEPYDASLLSNGVEEVVKSILKA